MEHTSSRPPSQTPSQTPSHTSPHPSSSITVYIVVYVALMILLVLTVAVAPLDLGAWDVAVALAIAWIKAVLVALYFMHLRQSSRLVWLFAAAGLAWLVILMTYTITDYLSRPWIVSF